MTPTTRLPRTARDVDSGWLWSAGQDGWNVAMAEIERRSEQDGEEINDDGLFIQAMRLLGVETHEAEKTFDQMENVYRADLDAIAPLPDLSEQAQSLLMSLENETEIVPFEPAIGKEVSQFTFVRLQRTRQIIRWGWQRDHLLHFDRRFYRPLPDGEINDDLLAWFGAIEPSNDITVPASAVRRPIISRAFKHDGVDGLGRISSSQINLAILTACVAPKSEWTHTAKGFPKYVFVVPSGEVDVVLKPEVVVSRDIATQVRAMEQIRDELSIDDFDLIAILQEQVMTDGSTTDNQGLISATMTDEYALDYCRLERKKRGGYLSNHHPKNRANLAESLNRITHLRVRTDTLQVRKITSQGALEKYTADWDEKVLSVEGNLTQRETDTTLVFRYTFGRSFTTYLTRPNRFVGYILQGTVALNGKKQIAKALAHYFALHLKMNASRGPELVRSIGQLFDGAKVPQSDRPRRTMEAFENAMRDLVREGLIRIKWGALILDSASPELDNWTAIPALGRKHDLLNQYRRQNLTILAPKVIEERYDREVRRGRQPLAVAAGQSQPTE